MLQLKNTSPFLAAITMFPNEHGIDHLYVIIKATFTINGKIEVAEEPSPIHMADEYWGEPETSSLKYASEIHLSKPCTDIIMTGHACAPDRKPVRALNVTLAVADKSKTARVYGDRTWESKVLGLSYSDPMPFETMPLVYERAYGGCHDVKGDQKKILAESRNPVGQGFKGKRSSSEFKGKALPNIEDPRKLISSPGDQPTPVGFGPVASSWEPRRRYAGTYDKAWQKQRAPYLPDDFDNRFFNSAPPDQICNGYLMGGEPVSITNMSENGPLKFNLPSCGMDLKVRVAGKTETPILNLETVSFEPNQSRFAMTWRAALACDKKALKVEQVDVGLKSLEI